MSPEMTGTIMQFGPLLVIFAIFYFILLRPQRKEQQRRAQMLAGLKKGERVVTIGGILGTITAISEKTVMLKVAEKVEIEFSRDSISRYQNSQKNENAAKTKPVKEAKKQVRTSEQNIPSAPSAAQPETVNNVDAAADQEKQ